MSNRMTKTGNSANRNRCIMERSITIPGLNLLITPKEQHGPCSAPNIALAIADATGFLERKPEHGRVLVFSLENTRKKTEQMLIQYNAGIGDITGLYTYKKRIFGNRIQEGLNMFLQDNTRTKMIVVDSLEKIVEAELGRMEYDYAYKKLCEIKNAADRHGATLLVGIYDGNPEDTGMLASIADTVLKIITEGGNQDNHKYTLHVNRKDIHVNKITAECGDNGCTWKQTMDK